jgi:hypothetical protein
MADMAGSTGLDELKVWDFGFELRIPFIERVMGSRRCTLSVEELRAGFVNRLKLEDYGDRLRIHSWIGVGGQQGHYGWRDYPRPRGTATTELWFLRGSVPPGSDRYISPYRWSLVLRNWDGALRASPLALELLFLQCQADDFGEESVLESAVIFAVPLEDGLLDEHRGTGQEREVNMVDRLRSVGEGYMWWGSGGNPEDWSWSLQRQW